MTEEAKSKAPGFTLRQFVKAGGDRLKLRSHAEMCAPLPQNMNGILDYSGVPATQALEGIEDCDNMQILNRMGIKWADGTSFISADDALKQVAEKFGKPVLEPKDATEWGTAYPEFYDLVWESSNEDA